MYAYRGADRRLAQKCLKTLQAIKKRDQLALNVNKKTSRLSTRSLILDNVSTGDGLLADANALIAQLNLVLTDVV